MRNRIHRKKLPNLKRLSLLCLLTVLMNSFIANAQIITNIDFVDDEETTENVEKLNERAYKRLLKEAKLMFKRMEYVKAARKYEKALTYETEHSPEIYGNLGDCYYFNSELEKAQKWYDELYNKHKDSMSSKQMFKYIHILKGNNQYPKSRNIQREYLAKIKEENTDDKKEITEAVFNNLINTVHPIEVKNLRINSAKSEFSPMYYGDQMVFATNNNGSKKKYGWDGNPFLDLYTTSVDKNTGEMTNMIALSKKINTKYHEASAAFSPDGKTMYFTRNDHKKKEGAGNDGVNRLMILKSEQKKNGVWKKPKILPFNNKKYSFGHPSISTDGKLMYFVSDMAGSLGETDLYVVDIKENGTYSTPRNLGDKINTKGKEMFPFFKGNQLFFASDGHPGLGGLDIFETTFGEEGFSTPKNLGKPINSNKDDFSYIVDKESNTGYFASNRKGGKGFDDIYFFKAKEEELIVENTEEEQEEETVATAIEEEEINIEEKATEEEVNAVDMTNVFEDEDGKRKIDVTNVLFGFDKSVIKEEAKKDIEKVIEFLQSNSNAKIRIESHTDSRGSKVYNKKLSQRRADATKAYLIANGVDASQIEDAIGYGESQLINSCDNDTPCSRNAHYQNRRSEFVITQM